MKFNRRGLCLLGCVAGFFLVGCRDHSGKSASGTSAATAVMVMEESKLFIPGDMIRVIAKTGTPPLAQEARELEIHELLKRGGVERVELISGKADDEIDPRWKSVKKDESFKFLLDREELHRLGVELVRVSEKLDSLMKSEGDVYGFLSAEVPAFDGRLIPVFKLGVLYLEADNGG